MDVLTEDWQLSQDTLDVLKLNQISDEHIAASLQFIKQKFVGTHIDEIEGYNSWGEFFIVFCIKAARPSPLNTDQQTPVEH